MPSWKKVIVSGSDASLNSLNVPSITGSLQGTASFATTASYAVNGGVTQLFAGPNITLAPTTGVGQVTISSTGTGTYYNTSTGSYGSFYDTTTQLNPVANIPRSMSLNTTDITNGVSVSGSSSPFNTYIKVTNAGVYNIQFSAQLIKTDSGTDYVDIWLRRNGVDLLDSATNVTLIGNNDRQVAAWNWFATAGAGDYYQIMWASADTNVQLLAESATGVHPGIPSVIVTANRIDTFLSNTGSFSGSFNGVLNGTASFAVTASFVTGSNVFGPFGANSILSASFATTASNAISASFLTSDTNAFLQGGNSFGTTAVLGTNDNQNLNIETSGSIRMSISNTGNVGIGTISPASRFEIKSSAANNLGGLLLRASASANYPVLIYETTQQSGILDLYSGSAITTRLHANGNSFLNGGNVGIGIITPSASLHVNGNAIITGSLAVTGSLFVTGSTTTDLVRITQAGSGNAFTVYDINSDNTPFVINSSGSVGIGTPTPSSYTARLIVLADSAGTSGIRATGFGNHAIIGNAGTNYAAVYGESVGDDAGEYFGGYFRAYQADTPVNTNIYIGAKFEASSDATNYSVQLKDGTQAAGKVLVSQDASGSANWSTQLSGSYALTGSLNMPSIVAPGSSNAKIHVANYPNPPGSLTAGTGSVLYNYGVYNEGLILQYGYSGDQGGIKITDDGVAIFGAGDDDILKVINEDSNTQVFSINDSGYVGINKIGVTSSITPTNAYLDVNGDAIITGSLTVTNNITGSGLYVSGSTSSDLVRITQTGTGNALVVEDSTNPDATPFIIDNAGNVGIGTTTLTNPLQISKTSDSYLKDGLRVDRDPSVSNSAIFNAFGGSANIISNSGTTSIFPSITFRSSDNTTVNELMRLTPVGLGIGTIPSATLDVNGNAIISGSTSTSLLSLTNTTTGNSRVIRMQEQLNGEINRTSVRAMTSAGNNGDDSQFNGWVNDHIIEYKSGSGIIPEQLKGWSWSYYTLIDYGFGPQGAYKDVLLISTSNQATLNGSLTVTGSTYLTGLASATTSNAVYIDTTTGALSYGAPGGGGGNAFPYTGSAIITGSLAVTGSVGISGSLNFNIIDSPNAYSNIFTGAGPRPISGSLAPSTASAVWTYGASDNGYNGLIIQTAGTSINDVGGLKVTEDGVAIFGGGDTDLLRVVDEDSNIQRFVITNNGQIGINKTSIDYTAGTPVNATLDVNGSTIVSGSLTTTSGVSLKGLSSNTTSNVIYIDTSTGALSYGAAISGSVTSSAFPYTGSARITGSLGVTGSISATTKINVTSPTFDDSVDILPGYVTITGNDGLSPITEKSSYSLDSTYYQWTIGNPAYYPKDDTYLAYGTNINTADYVRGGSALNLRRSWGHDGVQYTPGFEELIYAPDDWNQDSAPTSWYILATPSGSNIPQIRISVLATTSPLWNNTTLGNTSPNNEGHIFRSYTPARFDEDVSIQRDLQVQGNFVDDDASNTIDNKALIQSGLLYLSNNF